jgi:gamma-glutamylcysteine synthetase
MADKDKLFGVIKELSNSMTRVDGEKSFQKEAITAAAEEHGIEKKLLRKLAKTYHKQNFTEEKTVAEEFTELYETVIGEV